MKNANPTRFGPHGITGRSSTPALIARERNLSIAACLDRFINDGLEHRLHVPSALNVRSQGPIIFGAQFDFESVHKLFNLANSLRNSRRSCPNCEAVW
jgi:hypothetical protein